MRALRLLSLPALAALAWLAWLAPDLGLPTPVRLLPVCAGVFLLPGRLLLPPLGLRSPRILEEVAASAACSLILLTLLTVGWMTATASLPTLALTLLVLGTLGALVQPPEEEEDAAAPPVLWKAVALAALLALGAILWGIGGSALGTPYNEEQLHLSIIRKVLCQPTLGFFNLLYVPDTPTTYLYVPYHAAIAATSYLSHVDPVAVYLEIRPFFTLIALSGMYSILLTLSASRGFALAGLLVLQLLIVTNVAGQVVVGKLWYFGAQLAPLSHLGDFGAGVVLPLLLYLGARLLDEEKRSIPAVAAFVLLAWANLPLHARETVQILLDLGFVGVAWVALRRSVRDPVTLRLLIAAALVVLGGKVFQAHHHGIADEVIAFDQMQQATQGERFARLAEAPWWGLAQPEAYYVDEMLAQGLLPLMCLLAPMILVLWSRRTFLFPASIIVGFLLVFRIPALSALLVQFTYSEMLMSPSRNVNHPAFLLACAAVWGLARWMAGFLQRRPGLLAPLALAALSALLWGGLARGAAELQLRSNVGYYGLFFALVATFVLARASWAPRVQDWWEALPDPARSPRGSLALALASVGLVCTLVPPTLPEQFILRAGKPDPAVLGDWYDDTFLRGQIPFAMIEEIRRQVPSGATIAHDFAFELLGPMMADVRVCNSGLYLASDLWDFSNTVAQVRGDRTLSNVQSPAELHRRHERLIHLLTTEAPLFSSAWTDEHNLAFLDATRIEFLVFDSVRHAHLRELTSRYPERFETLAEVPGEQGATCWLVAVRRR